MASQELNNLELTHEPVTKAELVNFAAIAGFPSSTGELTPQLREFALMVMERCASVGDSYVDGGNKGNAGDDIRALFGLG